MYVVCAVSKHEKTGKEFTRQDRYKFRGTEGRYRIIVQMQVRERRDRDGWLKCGGKPCKRIQEIQMFETFRRKPWDCDLKFYENSMPRLAGAKAADTMFQSKLQAGGRAKRQGKRSRRETTVDMLRASVQGIMAGILRGQTYTTD